MINLLPQNERDALFLKRIRNLVLVLGIIIMIFLVCLILILLSVKFYILSEVDNQKFLLKSVQESYRSPDAEDIKNAIQKYNYVLPTILSFYREQMYFGDMIEEISGIQKPDGVQFANISLDGRSDETKIKVNISGTSDTREDLTAFQKNLEGNSLIKNISFSPESWINPTNVNFGVSLEFLKNKIPKDGD